LRALVTGCAGFIGSHLTERLLEDGWSVLGVDSFVPTYGTGRRRSWVSGMPWSPHFEFIESDIVDLDIAPLLEGCDVVFHLAAKPGVRASWADFGRVAEANIVATQRVLDAVSRAPSTRLVFASSSSVYGDSEAYPTTEEQSLAPISPYGVSNASGESLISAYVSQSGVEAVSLRYFTVYGPRQRSDMAFTIWMTRALRSQALPIFGDGNSVRDFTYVSDVVNATLASATCPVSGHEIFNVAGGSPATVNEVIGMIEELLGESVTRDHTERAKGDPRRTGGDTARLQTAPGWRPEWTLRDGLAAQLEWMRSAQG
jgi:UDP-glucuronate 4-epimerase